MTKEQTMKRRYRYRSAITGYYVTERFARAHPRTTVKEAVGRAPARKTARKR